MPDDIPLVRIAKAPPTLTQRISRTLYRLSVALCVLVLVGLVVAFLVRFGGAIMAGF